ncbi:MAG: ABC transporter ATP-binding protein [Roseiarcus sp.]
MLSLSQIHVAFDGQAAIDGLTLTVAAGEFVVVLGASGCGKTTLLRLAARSLAPSAGRVDNRFARVAVVFQEPRLMPWADALDNAAFGLKALGWAAAPRRAKARELLLRLGLRDSDLSKRPPALSGGMRQRVALARAMAIEPDLILMDEPFSALDLGLRRQLQDLLRAEVERAGTAALFVTHDVAEAARLASRIVVLSPRPARCVADLPNAPTRDPAAILRSAASLLQRPEIAGALLSHEDRSKGG